MYETLQSKIVRELQFQASVHGAELNGAPEVNTQSGEERQEQVPLFGNPEDYSHLSEEERQKQTDQMMNKHKTWSTDPLGSKVKTKGL